ncbi:hypothetical protein CLV59_1055 [Chitinophaga dinghuensis]|uniref:Uncharacterized protein n=1 Tax=Chitinophaga dinghuensis TaxID=1539050 RepID=A0A327VXI7_9BACT|nr:hypothetical protein [Chitinophaga dinghuensis]RAJ79900.1 hypothetical protein CLV59_1055 [Chitinophaga dinghuensis]
MKIGKLLLPGTALLAGLFMASSVQGQDADPNKWAPVNIQIDGKATEWPKPLSFYNNDTKLFYTIANDSNNLYVVISVPDPVSQMKIMRAGVTFSVNPTGKKKVVSSVTFPLLGEDAPEVVESQNQRTSIEWRRSILQNAKHINVEGLIGVPDGNLPVKNDKNIVSAASLDDQGNLVCEVAIPLQYLGLTISNDKPVAYRFKINPLNRDDRKAKEKEQKDRQAAIAAAQKEGKTPPAEHEGHGMYKGMNGPGMENLFYAKDFWTRQTMATHR